MPKKTNSFQELVALIERALAPQGAKVTESALITEGLREVDILIESISSGFVTKVAVEAKDERRPMDIVRFESIVGKYSKTSGILVDKVVLVNRSGFSKKVRERAPLEGITLLTLEEALTADWVATAKQQIFLRLPPHLAKIEFDPPVDTDLAKKILTRGHIVCICCGRDHGTPRSWAEKVLDDLDLIEELEVATSRGNGSICCTAAWELPERFVIRGEWGDHKAKTMTAHIHCTMARGALAVKAYQRGESIVHHFSGSVAGRDIQFVVPNGPHSENISLRISRTTSHDQSTKSIVVKGGLPRPEHPRSPTNPEVEEIKKILDASFHSLDVKILQDCTVHNFSTGSDHGVDLLVQFGIGDRRRLNTAILIRDRPEEETTPLLAYPSNFNVDRIIRIVKKENVTSSDGGWRIDLDKQTLAANPLNYVVPQALLWINCLNRFRLSFWGNQKRVATTPGENSRLLHRDEPIELNSFLEMVGAKIEPKAIAAFLDRKKPISVYAECEFTFSFRLPREMKFSCDNFELPVNSVQGSLLIYGLCTVLDKATFEEGAAPFLRLASTTGAFSIRTASLPREGRQLHVENPSDQQRIELPRYHLPESTFSGLLGSKTDLDKAFPNSSPYSIATVNAGVDPVWRMKLMSLHRHALMGSMRGL